MWRAQGGKSYYSPNTYYTGYVCSTFDALLPSFKISRFAVLSWKSISPWYCMVFSFVGALCPFESVYVSRLLLLGKIHKKVKSYFLVPTRLVSTNQTVTCMHRTCTCLYKLHVLACACYVHVYDTWLLVPCLNQQLHVEVRLACSRERNQEAVE